MSDWVILVELTVTSPAGVATVLRWADGAVRPFPSSDPDRPNAVFDDRLDEAPVLRRKLVEDMGSLTPGWGVGVLTIINRDRALDAYLDHVWGALTVWRYTPGQAFASAQLLLSGVAATPRPLEDGAKGGRVSVNLYDYRAELDKPLQTTNYSGSGTYEGTADTIKGRPKPLAYGDLTNAHLPPVLVNSAVLGHQLHDGLINGGVQIFDRGDNAGLTIDADRSGAGFDAYNPAAAHAVTDLGRGLLKINSAPQGGYTFGCRGDATGGYVNTAGPILRRMLLRLGVPAGRIDASVAGLSSTAPIGVFLDDSADARKTIEHVAVGALSAVLPGRDGIWRALKIDAPAAVADYVIDPFDVVRIEAEASAPVPAGAVRIGYDRIFTTFRGSDLAPALRTTAAADRLAEEWRWAVIENATVKARLPETWRTIEITTPLRAEADALALAGYVMGLFGLRLDGKPRRMWKVALPLRDDVQAVELGKTVSLTWPALGIDGRFVLFGEEPFAPARNFTTWTLWG